MAIPSVGELRRSEKEGPISTVPPYHRTFQAIRQTVRDLASRFYRGILVSLPVQAMRVGVGQVGASGGSKKAEGGRQSSYFRESPERLPKSIVKHVAPSSYLLQKQTQGWLCILSSQCTITEVPSSEAKGGGLISCVASYERESATARRAVTGVRQNGFKIMETRR